MLRLRLTQTSRRFSVHFMSGVLVLLCAFVAAADISPEMLTAARDGDVDAVRKLIAKGEDVNATSADGVTALMVAAGRGRGPLVCKWIKR